jgi:hypothetical protein
MAMKIGRAYEPDEVDPRQFEKLADEIGFTKPLVKRRVIDQAKKMLEQLDLVEVEHPVVNEIRKFVSNHCTTVLNRFTNDSGKKLGKYE